MDYGYYRIEFDANRKSRHDIYFANNAQKAVDYCRRDYEFLGELKIRRVYKDCGIMWKTTEAWE